MIINYSFIFYLSAFENSCRTLLDTVGFLTIAAVLVAVLEVLRIILDFGKHFWP